LPRTAFWTRAERLHLAQPPLSQQIRKLEELLGYPLHPNLALGELTTAGEALLQRARRTLRNVQRDIDEIAASGGAMLAPCISALLDRRLLTTLQGSSVLS